MARTFLLPLTVVFALLATVPIADAEGVGCASFKWPILRQQSALAAPNKPAIASDGALAVGAAGIVHLAPVDKMSFPKPPQRAPAPGTFAAVLNLQVAAAGVYTINLSDGAWIDVVQDGVELKPLAFSGAKDCPNIHKSLKFQFAARNTLIQFSNARANEISVVVLP